MNQILEQNLNFIKEYNPELAERVKNHTALSVNIELVHSKSGDANLIYDGKFVHDNNDPVYEAMSIYEKNVLQNDERIHIIYGLGLGYLLSRYASKFPGKVVVLEPNIDILRVVLELVDFSDVFSNNNISLAGNIEEVQACMKKLSVNYSDKLAISYTDFYNNMYTQEILGLMYGIQKINREQEKIDYPCKINIGAGRWEKPGWLTVDCYMEADIQVDLRKNTPLPIADGVVEKIFSSHCIEHIEDTHLEHMLKEAHRVMKPGAVMRLSCPDADEALQAYKNGNINWYSGIITRDGDPIGARLLNTFVSYEAGTGGPEQPEEVIKEKFETLSKQEFIEWCLSLCDRARPYIAHINGIYYEKLERMLKEKGFVNITKSSFGNSADEELRGPEFDLHESVSLFVECYKPA